jgi:hypothetical protein
MINIPFFINLSIGIDSFKDALYWWNENEMPAFWVELNIGYYQLHPQQFAEVMLGEDYADVVYTNDGVYTN